MPVPWPTNPNSPKLRISDPVHRLYKQVLGLELDLALRDHCTQLLAKFLTVDEDGRRFEDRALVAAGLSAYIEWVRLDVALKQARPGTDEYNALAPHVRAFIETLAKCHRLKGMYEPSRRRKPLKEGKRIPVSATVEHQEEPSTELEEVGSEA